MESLPPGVDLSQVPLAKNPSGAPPNFVDPPSLLIAVQSVGLVLGITALMLVITRLIILHRLKRPFGLDDASVILAWIFAAVYTGVSCALGGVTRHAWDTPITFLDSGYLKKLFVTSLVYGPMLFFCKASILIMYYRTFQRKVWLRVCIYVLLAIMAGTYWMTVPLCFYYCMPHPNTDQEWDLKILGNCNHLATPGLVQAGMNIAADIAIFVLPLPIVFRLQMPLGKKIGVAAIFATGLFALAASVLTIFYRVQIIRGYDVSWAGAQTYICIQTEVYTTIAVACMPSLAKIWNSKVRESRFYGSMQSLLSFIKGGSSNRSTVRHHTDDDSTSQLQTKGYNEIRASADSEGLPRFGPGIHKKTTIEMSSMPGVYTRSRP